MDMCSARSHVRFTPNGDRESGFPLRVMSALPPKADIGRARTRPGRRTKHLIGLPQRDRVGGGDLGDTTEITASPKLRARFAVAAAIMFALWGWSLVPPIENWGNPYDDGFSCVPFFYMTIICLPVGLYLLVGAIAGRGRYVRRARNAFLSLPELPYSSWRS